MAQLATELRFPAGTVLASQGGWSRQFIVLLEGTADMAVDGRYATALGPGEHFGECGILCGGTHQASLVARSAVKVLVMNHLEFRSAYDSIAPLRRHIDAEMGRKALAMLGMLVTSSVATGSAEVVATSELGYAGGSTTARARSAIATSRPSSSVTRTSITIWLRPARTTRDSAVSTLPARPAER